MKLSEGEIVNFKWPLMLLSLSLAAPSKPWAKKNALELIPKSTLKLRNAQIQIPFEIKILVKVINPESQGLKFSGFGLQWGHNQKIPDGDMNCRIHTEVFEKLRLLHDPLNSQNGWICENKNFKKRVGDTPTVLRAEAGFISIGEDLFRGTIEIYTRDSKLWIVNSLDLEPYLAGLVNREIRSDFPSEAVKAQIVAARSYALATAADRRRNGSLYDLSATESDQVYDGSLYEDAESHRRVSETQGEVLFHQEDILKSYYHSSNGGFSELPQNVWGDFEKRDKLAYLARPSPEDENLSNTKWQVTMSAAMGNLISPRFGKILSVRVLSRTAGKRVQAIQISGENDVKTLTGPQFRQLFGYRWIKSTYFQVQPVGKNFLIRGRGWGHGVGLSQLGARALAKKGKNYKEILGFYYPYSNLRRLDLGEINPSLESSQNIPVRAR
jgi:stage II sporulation protein D